MVDRSIRVKKGPQFLSYRHCPPVLFIPTRRPQSSRAAANTSHATQAQKWNVWVETTTRRMMKYSLAENSEGRAQAHDHWAPGISVSEASSMRPQGTREKARAVCHQRVRALAAAQAARVAEFFSLFWPRRAASCRPGRRTTCQGAARSNSSAQPSTAHHSTAPGVRGATPNARSMRNSRNIERIRTPSTSHAEGLAPMATQKARAHGQARRLAAASRRHPTGRHDDAGTGLRPRSGQGQAGTQKLLHPGLAVAWWHATPWGTRVRST